MFQSMSLFYKASVVILRYCQTHLSFEWLLFDLKTIFWLSSPAFLPWFKVAIKRALKTIHKEWVGTEQEHGEYKRENSKLAWHDNMNYDGNNRGILERVTENWWLRYRDNNCWSEQQVSAISWTCWSCWVSMNWGDGGKMVKKYYEGT